MKKNIVRQIKIQEILGKMLKENPELYEKILDSNISFYFNEITNLAMMDSFSKPQKKTKINLAQPIDKELIPFCVLKEKIQHFIKYNRKICWEAEMEDGEFCIGENRLLNFVDELMN